MFKKLQNKFLIMNIVSIFTVFIISLGIIYSITYTNIQKENKNKIEQASNIRLNATLDVTTTQKLTIEESENTENTTIDHVEKIATDFSVPFNLIINEENKIIKTNSYTDMSKTEYEELLKLALENKKSNTIKYKNKNWMYQISEEAYYEEDENANRATQRKIVFLDITDQVNSLNQFLITLVGIAIFMLIVIYFVSLYFARRAIKPIKEAWEKQKQFVENASHELKTPIASIKANVDVLLLNDTDQIKQQIKWIEYIRIETNKMAELTKKLLNLAKMENEQEEKVQHSFNLGKKLENIIVHKEALAIEKQIKIERQIDRNIIMLQDEERIKQVLEILLDNAFKYTNRKGNIKVILKRENKKVKISIQNTGIGIAKEDLPHIFDRFYKGDKARTNADNSYGLGLSIAKTAVEKIGGKITVDSVPNEITRFTVVLKSE